MKRKLIPLLVVTIAFFVTTSVAFATGDCSDYTDLSGQELPLTVTGTTVGTTGDYGPFMEQPGCWQGGWDPYCAASGDLTFKWTAPHDGLFTFTLVDSPGFADLLIYDFTCPAEPLYPDDYRCGAHQSHQSSATLWELELFAGQEILLVVDGYLTWNGAFTLRIYETTTLDDLVAMAMDLNHYPAVSAACAWGEGGRWRDNFGLADLDTGKPLNDNHLFPVYWLSPVVLGAALMQLWEDGLFGLDDDVGGFLPFVRHPAYPEIPITFRMLMAHVSGIRDNATMLNQTIVWDGDPTVTPCELMEGYLTPGGLYYDADANFWTGAPGTFYGYSNAGLTLLGCLVERLNPDELSFEDYCRTHIFDPLQMPTSAFLPSHIDPDDLVTQYQWVEPDYELRLPYASALYPARELLTNARELSRFMLAFMQGGEVSGRRILEAATIDTMLTGQYPELVGEPSHQGLVWLNWRDSDDRWLWGLGGVNARSLTGLWISRDENLGAIALTNCAGSSGYATPQDILGAEFRRASEWAAAGVGVPDDLPATHVLAQLGPCYPNPFNPQATINLSFARDLRAEVGVYDLLGRRLSLLADRQFTAGTHTLDWNGCDAQGRAMPSGTYIVRLETASSVEASKISLIR